MAVQAGQRILALDFAGSAAVFDDTDETSFNSTTYTLGATTVGVSFMAPTSGHVLIIFGGRIQLNVAAALRVLLSAEIRTGSTIGSGTVVLGASDSAALECGVDLNSRLQASKARDVSGLTPGDTYNVSLWHKNGVSQAGAGTIFTREVYVQPQYI